MRRAMIGCLALVAACATKPPLKGSTGQAVAETETRCRLIGSLAGYFEQDPRRVVLDETKSPGPTKVIWLNPPETTMIRTVDGLVYRCDARL